MSSRTWLLEPNVFHPLIHMGVKTTAAFLAPQGWPNGFGNLSSLPSSRPRPRTACFSDIGSKTASNCVEGCQTGYPEISLLKIKREREMHTHTFKRLQHATIFNSFNRIGNK